MLLLYVLYCHINLLNKKFIESGDMHDLLCKIGLLIEVHILFKKIIIIFYFLLILWFDIEFVIFQLIFFSKFIDPIHFYFHSK